MLDALVADIALAAPGGARTALLVDGPERFCAHEPGRALGGALLTWRLFAARGWKVASLPAAAWAALPGPAERAAYVLRLLQLPPKPSPNPGQAPASAALPGSAPDTPTSGAPGLAPPPPPPPPPPPTPPVASMAVPTLVASAGGLMGAHHGNPMQGQGPADTAAATALLERLALQQEGSGGVSAGVPMPGQGSGSSSGGGGTQGYGGEASAGEWQSGGSDTTNVAAGFPWQDPALLERCGEES